MKNIQNIIVYTFFALVMSGLVYGIYVVHTDIVLSGEHISTLMQQSASMSHDAENIKKFNTSLDHIKPQIDQIDSYFVASDGEVSFIEQVEGLAKKDGLTVSIDSVGITNTDTLTSGGIAYLTMKINTAGTWEHTYQFLSEIEDMPYRIFIDQTDIASMYDGSPANTGMWKGGFSIKVLKKI